jgi:CBS domain-containing protein
VGEPGLTILPVVEDNKLVGVITKADLLHLVDCKKKLNEITKNKLHVVSSDDRVVHARRVMLNEGVARLPVLSDGELVGIISDTEIAFAFADLKKSQPMGRQKHRLEELLVRDYMKSPAIWTNPSTSISDAAKIMIKNNIGSLPILENGKIISIVTRTDLLKTLPC